MSVSPLPKVLHSATGKQAGRNTIGMRLKEKLCKTCSTLHTMHTECVAVASHYRRRCPSKLGHIATCTTSAPCTTCHQHLPCTET